MTIYIGIDQSLTATGLCRLSDNGIVVDNYLVKPKNLDGIRRLRYICDGLRDFFRGIDGPIRSTREEYSFASKGQAVFQLGELGGCVDMTLYVLGLEIDDFHHYRIPPGVHKKYCTGDGSLSKGTTVADKRVYVETIAKHTLELWHDDNVADAYMLAKTLHASFKVLSDPEFFMVMNREEKLTLVPPSTRKVNKLTPARIDKLEYEDYCTMMTAAFDATYEVF